MVFKPGPRMAPIVYEFIEATYPGRSKSTTKHAEYCLRKLHDWMDENLYDFNDIEQLQLLAFEERLLECGFDVIYRRTIREFVHKYLIWLHEKGLFKANLKELFPRMKPHARMYVQLPDLAMTYLSTIRARLSQNAATHHGTVLRRFYLFVEKNPVLISEINRAYIEKYLVSLSGHGWAPSHRFTLISFLRQYLRWLYEHGHIGEYPDYLIRPMDLPKLPKFLPRPLPVDIDMGLQKKFESSESNLHKGLLLMRRTGLRVGEIRSLKFNCVKTDIGGNHFLKVELGKLKTERLVPLDPTTLALIGIIQEKTKSFDPKSEHLLRYHKSRDVEVQHLQLALNDLTNNFQTEKPIVSHQLRHTFATTMLNAGMNLVALRDIMGHRDIRMTLRYAAVAQKTVREEYFRALKNLDLKYEIPKSTSQPEFDFTGTMGDLIRYLKTKMASDDEKTRRKRALLIRRLQRLEQTAHTWL